MWIGVFTDVFLLMNFEVTFIYSLPLLVFFPLFALDDRQKQVKVVEPPNAILTTFFTKNLPHPKKCRNPFSS